jgi:hypothetical protein
MISKPIWLLFAETVRQRIDNMKSSKSGKREADAMYHAWLQATNEKGYPGSENDWQILLRRLERKKQNRRY